MTKEDQRIELLESLYRRWREVDKSNDEQKETLLDEFEDIAFAYYGNEREVNH